MQEQIIQASKKIYKIVAVSDTHASNFQLSKLIQDNQQGDIFIHCGDFTRYGRQQHFDKFFALLKSLKFKYKIVIAGNHQISLDPKLTENRRKRFLTKYPCKYNRQQLLKMLKQNCIYLQHEYVEIQGIKIFGSPYTKKHGSSAFQINKDQQRLIWKQLPEVDILLTHSPPYGILDQASNQNHGGSQLLREQVFRIKPQYHIFGHIHQGRGQKNIKGIKFINVAKDAVKIQFSK